MKRKQFLTIVVMVAASYGATDASAADVEFIFDEVIAGTWDVSVAVGGPDTNGLASYNIQLVDLLPGQNATITFTENTLTTLETGTFDNVGFDGSPLVGPVGDTQFDAANSQVNDEAPLLGVGGDPIFVDGFDAASAPDINLGVPALLGTLTTPLGLNAENFNPNANVFDASGGTGFDAILNADAVSITSTVVPIPEPTTASLALALGTAALLKRRRKV